MDFLLCFDCGEIMSTEPFMFKSDWMVICGQCGVINKLRKVPDAIPSKFAVTGAINDVKQ